MKTAIVGTGLMGQATAYGMARLGHDIILVDQNTDKINQCVTKLHQHGIDILYSTFNIKDVVACDLVISCATYVANPSIVKVCLERGWHYTDLGGDTATSDKIYELATRHREDGGRPCIVMDHVGVAPGLINILAETIVAAKPLPKSIRMCVGGLPVNPRNTMQYNCTWSVEGLRNEYSGSCEIIRNTFHSKVDALSEVEEIDFPEVGKLECFHTKGGIGSSLQTMLKRGVLHCEYRTLRYPGHVKFIKFLMNECQLSPEEFNKAISNACPSIKEDMILMAVDVDNVHKRIKIMHDADWTAMQKSTGFTIAAVSALIAEGKTEKKPILMYSDFAQLTGEIQKKLDFIGGMPKVFDETNM